MSGGLAKCMLLMMMGCALGIWVDICSANRLHLGMIYRYSDEFKALMEARNKKPVEGWTMEGSVEHHEKLIKRDRHRHASMRNLISSQNGTYSLSPTNETGSVDNLGGLHYSLITIGTPSLSFLVALDTGSDLLWVPCNCQQCSATNWASYGLQSQNLEFSVYNLSNSNTRKFVSCSDSLCSSTLSSSNCTNANEKCNYLVDYASANTSTSGVLVEDVLYLNSETSSGGTITTPIYFGCGEVQTGDLVEGVAPDGLFGLGPNDISVPSTLARNGIVSKSFSMCFSSSDSSGRLVFGSQEKTGLQNTSLIPTNPSVYYVVMATKWAINKESIAVSEELIFDTGTSYTTLPYSDSQNIGKIFNKKINLPQFQLNGTFDFCWNISDSNDLDSLPSLIITFSGGSTWDIATPYITFVDSAGNVQFFCLGIIPSSSSSSSSSGIIGHNFMGGYEFFFDQESMTFGWASSDCYNPNASSTAKSSQGPTIINVTSTPSSAPSSSGAQSEPNRAFHNLSILSFHLVLLFSLMTLNLLYIR